jgi:hypothetical protein
VPAQEPDLEASVVVEPSTDTDPAARPIARRSQSSRPASSTLSASVPETSVSTNTVVVADKAEETVAQPITTVRSAVQGLSATPRRTAESTAARQSAPLMAAAVAGRGGTAYLARVPESAVLDLTKYEYWNGSTWVVNRPSAATPILPANSTSTGGFLGWLSRLFGPHLFERQRDVGAIQPVSETSTSCSTPTSATTW